MLAHPSHSDAREQAEVCGVSVKEEILWIFNSTSSVVYRFAHFWIVVDFLNSLTMRSSGVTITPLISCFQIKLVNS